MAQEIQPETFNGHQAVFCAMEVKKIRKELKRNFLSVDIKDHPQSGTKRLTV